MNADEKRRDFLKKAGKFALYTPPALMMLMHPSTRAIARSGGNLGGNRPDVNARMDDMVSRMRARIDTLRARFR